MQKLFALIDFISLCCFGFVTKATATTTTFCCWFMIDCDSCYNNSLTRFYSSWVIKFMNKTFSPSQRLERILSRQFFVTSAYAKNKNEFYNLLGICWFLYIDGCRLLEEQWFASKMPGHPKLICGIGDVLRMKFYFSTK